MPHITIHSWDISYVSGYTRPKAANAAVITPAGGIILPIVEADISTFAASSGGKPDFGTYGAFVTVYRCADGNITATDKRASSGVDFS